jgi:hypothetical protein
MPSISDFVFLPFSAAEFSPEDAGVYKVVVNSYWFVHPDRGFAFYRHGRSLIPQYNTSRHIGECFTFYSEFGFELRLAPLVVLRLPREITPLNKDFVEEILRADDVSTAKRPPQ